MFAVVFEQPNSPNHAVLITAVLSVQPGRIFREIDEIDTCLTTTLLSKNGWKFVDYQAEVSSLSGWVIKLQVDNVTFVLAWDGVVQHFFLIFGEFHT